MFVVASLTNDEIKRRIKVNFEKFVSDVEPATLSDRLIQENVIISDRWQAIRHDNPTQRDQCRALLTHLFSSQHPRAFLVVLEALSKETHYLLEIIANQEPQRGLRERSDNETIVQGQFVITFCRYIFMP